MAHDLPPPEEILAEGKTKLIRLSDIPGEVLIESKPDITAGDGARRDVIPGKDVLATQTTVNCFHLLERFDIPTHFIGEVDERTFRAKQVEMIPIELVVRRRAFGSYLNRNPDAVSQQEFENLVFEMFAKDDSRHDPLMVYNDETGEFDFYDPKEPVSAESELPGHPRDPDYQVSFEQREQLRLLSLAVFRIIEDRWTEQDVVLVDMKIECGFDEDGNIIVADVIDNDSWRIWPGGDPSNMKDKQLYRDGQALGDVAESYEWVADATDRF